MSKIAYELFPGGPHIWKSLLSSGGTAHPHGYKQLDTINDWHYCKVDVGHMVRRLALVYGFTPETVKWIKLRLFFKGTQTRAKGYLMTLAPVGLLATPTDIKAIQGIQDKFFDPMFAHKCFSNGLTKTFKDYGYPLEIDPAVLFRRVSSDRNASNAKLLRDFSHLYIFHSEVGHTEFKDDAFDFSLTVKYKPQDKPARLDPYEAESTLFLRDMATFESNLSLNVIYENNSLSNETQLTRKKIANALILEMDDIPLDIKDKFTTLESNLEKTWYEQVQVATSELIDWIKGIFTDNLGLSSAIVAAVGLMTPGLPVRMVLSYLKANATGLSKTLLKDALMALFQHILMNKSYTSNATKESDEFWRKEREKEEAAKNSGTKDTQQKGG